MYKRFLKTSIPVILTTCILFIDNHADTVLNTVVQSSHYDKLLWCEIKCNGSSVFQVVSFATDNRSRENLAMYNSRTLTSIFNTSRFTGIHDGETDHCVQYTKTTSGYSHSKFFNYHLCLKLCSLSILRRSPLWVLEIRRCGRHNQITTYHVKSTCRASTSTFYLISLITCFAG